MVNNFNFIQPATSSLNFDFGSTGSGPYYNFNFTESEYTPSYDFNFGETYNVYTILKGLTNNFVAIWADFDAGLNNGKMYVSSASAFSIVNLSDHSIEDWYSISHIGRANKSLEHEDIVDLNVR